MNKELELKLALCASILKNAQDEMDTLLKDFINKPPQLNCSFHGLDQSFFDKLGYSETNNIDTYYEYLSAKYIDEASGFKSDYSNLGIYFYSRHSIILSLSTKLDYNDLIKEPYERDEACNYSHPEYIVELKGNIRMYRECEVIRNTVLMHNGPLGDKWIDIKTIFGERILRPFYLNPGLTIERLKPIKVVPFNKGKKRFVKMIFQGELPF